MAAYQSSDGHWRVSAIAYLGNDGKRTELIRVEHDSPAVDGRVPMHWDGEHRYGPMRTGRGWWLMQDMPLPAGAVARDVAEQFAARLGT
jgi:hypothetical protein